MTLNKRLAQLEQLLERLTAVPGETANYYVRPPCEPQLTTAELDQQNATELQRQLVFDVSAMIASVPATPDS